jgi:polysaccharide deacetylase family protein (PEP-CTERM system associated)
MLNALTIDVEDGWLIFARDFLSKNICPTEMLVEEVERVLEILSYKNVKATFFVAGNVAEKFPSLVKSIVKNKHELGIHGFSHRQIFRLSKDEFRLEVRKAKNLLEELTSEAVIGHRAPVFSISPETKWSLRILAEEGFTYDSSIVPCKNPRYGWKGFSKDICRIELEGGLSIVEVPLSCLPIPLTNKGFVTGGGYVRCFPYFVLHAVIKHIQRTRPVIVYLHQHEFGKEVPYLPMEHLSISSRWVIRYILAKGLKNRHTVPVKAQKLLSDFSFGTIKNVLEQWFSQH